MDLEAQNYRRYIHIKVVSIIKTFDGGELNVELKDFPVPKCTEENFQGNEFEQKYWKLNKDSRHQYCIDGNKDIYLQGTRDSLILEQDHAYFRYEI